MPNSGLTSDGYRFRYDPFSLGNLPQSSPFLRCGVVLTPAIAANEESARGISSQNKLVIVGISGD